MMTKRINPALFWLTVYTLLNVFASGRLAVPAAAWLVGIFGLRFLHVYDGKRRTLLFFLASWLSLSVTWYGGTPIWGAAFFVFMAVNALLGMIPYLLHCWLIARLLPDGGLTAPPLWTTLIFPVATTALEYLTINGSPLGNFGALGNSQWGVPFLPQLVSLTGMLGLTFVISWFAAVVNWAWLHNFTWRRIRAGVVPLSALFVLIFAYGAQRIWRAPAVAAGETAQIASFTLSPVEMAELAPLLDEDPAAFREETRAMHDAYLAETIAATEAGANIILWPELAGIGVDEDVQTLLTAGRQLAGARDIYLAIPTFTFFPDEEDRPIENVLYIAGPDGEIVLEHVKYGGNLIEGTLPGSGELQTVETPYGTLSGVICWDTNFPGTIRQAGRQGVDILLSPAKEWPGIDPMHAEMGAFRALENGLTLVRQTDSGRSIIVDPYGRTLASAPWEGESAMTAAVPVSGVETLYPHLGDLLGLLASVALAGLLVWAQFWYRPFATGPVSARPEPVTSRQAG